MTRQELEALRDRLAKATGPNWQLDEAISQTVLGLPPSGTAGPRPFTSSHDAAMRLLEPWMEYRISTLYDIADFECPLNGGDLSFPVTVRRKDGSVTLAICQWRVEYELQKAVEP